MADSSNNNILEPDDIKLKEGGLGGDTSAMPSPSSTSSVENDSASLKMIDKEEQRGSLRVIPEHDPESSGHEFALGKYREPEPQHRSMHSLADASR